MPGIYGDFTIKRVGWAATISYMPDSDIRKTTNGKNL